ncbi:cupredoxin domain-containing protein, partial [Candidatus Woesearchaeota archaeon]|nr:cupredoxin domain-containing protein [Candidatus Woesearchaeota archaeon]
KQVQPVLKEPVVEVVEDESAPVVEQEQPVAEPESVAEEEPEPLAEEEQQETEEVEEEPKEKELPLKEFTVEADDRGFYPSYLEVNKFDRVRITFKVRDENIDRGGLEFKSYMFEDTGIVPPGEEATVEFIVSETFMIRSYWPETSVTKAALKVQVV